MQNKRVLISGASIAGPALGYWLQRYGFDVTIVETFPSMRKGGYKIDVRGIAVDVLKKMGIYPEARKHKIVMQGGTFLDEKGSILHEIPPEHMGMHVGDDIELWRFVDKNQRLGEVIIEHMIPKGKVESWMGDSILDQIQSAANCIPLKEYQ